MYASVFVLLAYICTDTHIIHSLSTYKPTNVKQFQNLIVKIITIYIFQKFRVGTIFSWYNANQGCTYLVKNTVKQ